MPFKQLMGSAVALLISFGVIGNALADPAPRTEPAPGTERYIIKFEGPSVARALGPMTREATHRRTSSGRMVFNPRSEAALQRLEELRRQQDQRIGDIRSALGRDVKMVSRFDMVLNGVAMDLKPGEADIIAGLEFVDFLEVEPREHLFTFAGPTWIGADHIWDGSGTPVEVGNRGEGLVAGIVDTGVNLQDHPSFVGTDDEGYTHTNPLGDGNYLGACDPGNASQYEPDLDCNSKVIGSWRFTGSTADDTGGHGSHTASITAGNHVDGPVTADGEPQPVPFVSGVAPRANIISYKACGTVGCFTSDALNQALVDGVNAVNYSIGPTSGRGQNPWTNTPNAIMFDMVAAGMFVAASAGNTGDGNPNPEADVVNKAPWIMTVANSSHGGIVSNPVSATDPEPPASLEEIPGREGTGPSLSSDITGEIVWAEDVDPDNKWGCDAWSGTPFDNSIALISRGGPPPPGEPCAFSVKVDNAEAAGAIGVVIYNDQGDGSIVMGGLETTSIPSVMIGQSQGEDLGMFAADNPGNSGLIDSEKLVQFDEASGDILSSGSLTGPNLDFDVTQPDITAPGTSILAAYAGAGAPFAYLSGTSMSGPHIAGSGLVMMNARPDWTVTEINSAIMLTAKQGGRKADGVTLADPDDIGSGTADLSKAAMSGLVMNETIAGFEAARYDTGGDPRTLNLPHMRHTSCSPDCSWTRTVRGTLEGGSNWTVSANGDGFDVEVIPSSFELLEGDVIRRGSFESDGEPTSSFQELEINVTNNTAGDEMHFGEIVLEEDAEQAPDARMTISVSESLPPSPPL